MGTRSPEPWRRDFTADSFLVLERELFGHHLMKLREAPRAPATTPFPAMSIAETKAAIEVTLEIPGVAEGDVRVDLDGDRLIVSGEKAVEIRDDGRGWHVMERRFGSFRRSVVLPFRPEADAISARHDRGVLRLSVRKPEAKAGAPRQQ